MSIYSVTFSQETQTYNLVEHSDSALLDPTNNKPIGRKFLAKGLTYQEANEMKNRLDVEQGSHPLQFHGRPETAMDMNPKKTIFVK